MIYISVVPAIRTPYGVDVFDYRIDDASDVQAGDLIRAPFRRRWLPALVIKKAEKSKYSGKILGLNNVQPLVRFPSMIVSLLDLAAARTFCSKATVLQSWIRKVPARAAPPATTYGRGCLVRTRGGRLGPPFQTGIDLTEYVIDRLGRVIELARKTPGRLLILTPWQNRAREIAQALDAPVLHAGLADGMAWQAWTQFVFKADGILVATRIGAWLAHAADAVIIDEPENDDHKQDELAPRLDARWLVNAANELKPSLEVIKIGTTPPLAEAPDMESINAPEIRVPISAIPFDRGSYSAISEINALTEIKIQEALADGRLVVILHPIKGERSRTVCRDCGWRAECEFCAFPLSQFETQTQCGHCGRKSGLPMACPVCGNADLGKSRAGKSKLAREIHERFEKENIMILDLSEWREYQLEKNSLVVVTDLALIGGYAEDIRRRERLMIAWRRLAARVSTAKSELIVQGQAQLLDGARDWLTLAGFKTAWQKEWDERQTFRYPPATQRIKILIDGSENQVKEIKTRLEKSIPSDWSADGPYKVMFRAKTRKPRCVLHLLPISGASLSAIQSVLEPLAKEVMIDLDPIAFFY